MKLTSPVFKINEGVLSKYTCDGDNVSPPLRFTDVPVNTRSMLLMLEDPSADPKPWIHWSVFNIPPYTKEFAEGEIPDGAVESVTCTNKYGYDAPCISEDRDFVFKLYALDSELNLPADSDRKVILKAIMGHVIEEAELVVRFVNVKHKPSFNF